LDVICLLGGTLVLGIVINELLGLYFGYSHFLGFIQACSFENPDGFRAISEPINYLFTRIENIAEIALFLSLGCLAVLFHPEQLEVRFLDINDDWNAVSIIGIFVLLLLFISGAFRTGETARACLFIYPYIFLAFRKIKNPLLTHITMIAGLQTIVMQLFGEYVW
ncbi:MAG: hypothetical protein ISR58_16530, partial [Anaerolineales bacterium]|nr:hypothetical protein [Anaerolineales bacterium]